MEPIPASQELCDKAKKLYAAGDFPAAAETFRQAQDAFLSAGDSLMAAEMQNNRSVTFLRMGDAEAALSALQGSDKAFAAAGDLRRQGMALANMASALQVLKRHKEAISHYESAADCLQKAGEGGLRVQVMQLLAMLYLRRFKFYDAVLALQSGLAGVPDPTPRQRLMKKILFMRL